MSSTLKSRSTRSSTRTVYTLTTPSSSSSSSSSSSFLSPPWPTFPSSSSLLTTITSTLLDLLKSLNTNNNHILIGPNQITQHLEHLSSRSHHIPNSLPSHLLPPQPSKDQSKSPVEKEKKKKGLLAIFVTRNDSQPSGIHSHLPLLCSITKTRLVALPKGSEEKMCNILKSTGRISGGRVYMIGIFDNMSGSEALRDIFAGGRGGIKEGKEGMNRGIGMIELPMALRKDTKWQATRWNAVETVIGDKREKDKKKRKRRRRRRKAVNGKVNEKVARDDSDAIEMKELIRPG